MNGGTDNGERRPGEGGTRGIPRKPRGFLFLVIASLALILMLMFTNPMAGIGSTRPVSFLQFIEEVKQKKIVEVWMDGAGKLKGAYVEGYIAPDNRKYPFAESIYSPAYFEGPEGWREIIGALPSPDKFHYDQPGPWVTILLPLVPWLVLALMFYYFFFRPLRSQGGPGGVLSFGRSRAKMVSPDKKRVTFADVAGIEEAKEEVQEIIEFLKDPQKFQRLGARIPRGVLLVGPPGTGKTLLAKAIAGEAGVPFFSISGSDFVEMFVGVGASRVRDLFQQAKEKCPCIIFLDEIDAVGRRRGSGLGGGHDEREQTLNAILVEMDGFDTDDGVIVLASTNRPDVLDPALLRPGRFDREIVIDLPDVKGREEILLVHAKKVKLRNPADLEVVARSTPTFSGADLEAVINEAALLAVMKKRNGIELEDLEEARDKVKWGRQKRSKVMDEADKKITAVHESGHAIVSALLPGTEPLHKVTIIPRGMALGATMSLPDKDRYHMQKQYILNQLAILFGGRCAEELFLSDISSGARDDIKRATDLVRAMICEWGMSENLGPISYSEAEETLFLGREVTRTRNHSEQVAVEIDREMKRILDEAYRRAKALLEANRVVVEKVAGQLLKYEVLTGEEVRGIMAGEDVEDIRRRVSARREAAIRQLPPAPAAPAAARPEPPRVLRPGDQPLPGPAGA